MNYSSFLLKKIYRNRVNIIPFLLIALSIIIIYISNHITAYYEITDPYSSGEEEIIQLDKDIYSLQQDMETYDSSSDEYTLASKNLDSMMQRKNLLQQKYDSITHHDWQSYYTSQLTLINITLETIESDHSISSDTYDIMKLQQHYFQYMLDHHLGYDDFFHSTQGISYMLQMMNDYLPFFMEILIIFIASMIYCSSFQNNLNIHQLIPISCFSKHIIKLLTTTLIGILVVVFIQFIAYLCGVIGNSSGHFDSPILIYSLQEAKGYVSFASMAL